MGAQMQLRAYSRVCLGLDGETPSCAGLAIREQDPL
jgi:hypothetical protein